MVMVAGDGTVRNFGRLARCRGGWMKWSVGRSEANRPRGKKDGRTALFLPFGRCDGVRSKVGRAGLCMPGGARCVSLRVVWRMEGVYSCAPLG